MGGRISDGQAPVTVGDHLRALAARLGVAGRRGRRHHVARPPREPVFRRASIVPVGGEPRSVALKNISATGARIEFYTREPLPAEFLLLEPIRGVRRRARVVWEEEFAAGLVFVDN
ncbi:MAG: hypothetical protein NW200_14515 [Hyphomonadaceae bacterium]|nr:hypothetical protein [Hyphomonadaceae bacterium]